ncbi:hypothetical protein MKX01_023277 [Papaver californicum]|nr:hypothetical protein MKX01_023277 [Papaver californicum]
MLQTLTWYPSNTHHLQCQFFNNGSFLVSAQILAGSHSPKSCRLLKLPARLHLSSPAASRLLTDVAKRALVLDAAVDIGGTAKVLWWDHSLTYTWIVILQLILFFLMLLITETSVRFSFFYG